MTASALTTDVLRSVLRSLPDLDEARDDAERIDRLRLFEELKGALAAAQAVEAVALDASRRQQHAAAGLPASRRGSGAANEIALAMRTSPYRGRRWLGWAKIMTTELPRTFAELQAGRTTEWRTMLMARETAVLSRAHRCAIDRELAPLLEGWGDKQTADEARRAGYRLDPAASVARAANAENDRQVSLRPAPDTMSRLSLLLPVAQGVAAFAALRQAADAVVGHGDEHRTRAQVMADTAVERLTGQASASAVPIEVELLMTDQALLAADDGRDEPAHLLGFGPIPAGVARNLVTGNGAGPAWVRRLYTRPTTGELAAMETRRRRFSPAQRRFLRLRDQACRTPWCDAPGRHADHIVPFARGGSTRVDNGQSLSEGCNYAKQSPGWTTRAGPDGCVDTITPTGHTYRSSLPALPGRPRGPGPIYVDYLWPHAA